MFSALFGKKPDESDRRPWDRLRYRSIEVAIWKSRKEGCTSFAFGLSRLYQLDNKPKFGKSFHLENLWDTVCALELFCRFLLTRRDISAKDEELARDVISAFECMMSHPSRFNPHQAGLKPPERINGHGEPNF